MNKRSYPLQEVDAEEGGGRSLHGGRLIHSPRYESACIPAEWCEVVDLCARPTFHGRIQCVL